MARRRTITWRIKLSLLLLFFSIAPMTAVTYWSLDFLERTFSESTLQGLEALARAKAGSIDHFTEMRLRDVERIASLLAPELVRLNTEQQEAGTVKKDPEALPELKDAEELPAKPSEKPKKPSPPEEPPEPEVSDPALDAARSAFLKLPKSVRRQLSPKELAKVQAMEARVNLKRTLGLILWDQMEFEELLVIDNAGRVVSSTFPGHEGKNAAGIEYFQNGRKATYVQPVFLSPITEQLTMVIATPIRDERSQQLGVLAARLNLKRFYQLINDSTGLGKTGETVVAKKVAKNLVFMAPTRHDDAAALTRTIKIGAPLSGALQEAARGQSGAGPQTDYRGVDTFAAWQYIPTLDWGLLVKIDKGEAMAGVQTVRERILILALLVLLLVIPASLVTARALVQPLRELKEATDRISRGDFAVQLNIRSRDEIGELADSFERMVAAIKFFREHSRSVEEEEAEGVEEATDSGS